jgi:hypothetical protein
MAGRELLGTIFYDIPASDLNSLSQQAPEARRFNTTAPQVTRPAHDSPTFMHREEAPMTESERCLEKRSSPLPTRRFCSRCHRPDNPQRHCRPFSHSLVVIAADCASIVAGGLAVLAVLSYHRRQGLNKLKGKRKLNLPHSGVKDGCL